MHVMAFAIDKDRLTTIEHHRRFYGHLYSTPVYEHLMELTVQGGYLYDEANEQNRYRGYPCAAWERAYADECRLASDHVHLMHKQVSESWQQQQAFDWNVSYGMSPADAAERMARR